MTKLLRAGFARLFNDRIFWICNAVMAVLGIYIALDRYFATIIYDSFHEAPDDAVFAFLSYGGIVYAIFSALFVGREYSDGTIRNKFIVGHTRVSVFLSTFIVTAVGNVIITLAYVIPAGIISVATLGWFERSEYIIGVTFIALIILAVAYTAIYTVLALLNSNKAVNAVVCVILSLALVIVANAMFSALNEPEFYSPAAVYEMDDNGVIVQTDAPEVPNPYYITGVKRQVYQVIADILPGGQSAQLPFLQSDHPDILALWSLAVILVTNGLGILLFSRKDIK